MPVLAGVASERYTKVAALLHWLMALLIIGLLAAGLIMTGLPAGPDKIALYQLHKSFGISVLLLTLVRILWRLAHRPPPAPESMTGWERHVAAFVHFLFYLLMLLLPLTGWAMASSSPFKIPTVLFGLLPWPDLPLPRDKDLAGMFADRHEALAFVLMGLLALHILAALRHHFLLKDGLLKRMAPFALVFFLVAPMAAQAHAASVPVWVVDAAHSRLEFTGRMAGEDFTGRFGEFSAQIAFDPAAPESGSVQVVVKTGTALTGDRQKDEALPQEEWFFTTQFPEARFHSTHMAFAPDTRAGGAGRDYVMNGLLTLKGVSQPVVLHFHLDELGGGRVRVTGGGEILRNAFAIGTGEWNSEEWLAFPVRLNFTLEAVRG